MTSWRRANERHPKGASGRHRPVRPVHAIAAAAWQHYGDQAKAMAVNWAPESVLAVLFPWETPAGRTGCHPGHSSRSSGSGRNDRAAHRAGHAGAGRRARSNAPFDEGSRPQSMAQDLAAMTRQVEELKASIAQLRTSHAQMAREVAKAADARASETRPPERTPRPRVASSTSAASRPHRPHRVGRRRHKPPHSAGPAVAAGGRRPGAGATRAGTATGRRWRNRWCGRRCRCGKRSVARVERRKPSYEAARLSSGAGRASS